MLLMLLFFLFVFLLLFWNVIVDKNWRWYRREVGLWRVRNIPPSSHVSCDSVELGGIAEITHPRTTDKSSDCFDGSNVCDGFCYLGGRTLYRTPDN